VYGKVHTYGSTFVNININIFMLDHLITVCLDRGDDKIIDSNWNIPSENEFHLREGESSAVKSYLLLFLPLLFLFLIPLFRCEIYPFQVFLGSVFEINKLSHILFNNAV
jgi:hypothetical protein